MAPFRFGDPSRKASFRYLAPSGRLGESESTGRRKDGDRVGVGVRQSELVQIVSLVECSGGAPNIRIEVDLRPEYPHCSWTVELYPSSIARRDHNLKTWCCARKTVTQRTAQLTRLTGQRETVRLFRIIVEDSEERAERRSRRPQITVDAINDQEGVIAVTARLDR